MAFLKEKSPSFCCKKCNFNNCETETKMENSTHIFREMSLMPQLIEASRIKNKTEELKIAKEKRVFLSSIYFVLRKFLQRILSQCRESIEITFRNVQSFTYQKTLRHALFSLFLKSPKVFTISSRMMKIFPANKSQSCSSKIK